ncbi:hypothetical protein D3C81_2323380 [compost metagenome]
MFADEAELAMIFVGQLHIHFDGNVIGEMNIDEEMPLSITHPRLWLLDQQALE